MTNVKWGAVLGQPVRLDELDVALLAALSEDARLSLRELARRVGSTAPTVSARLERLQASGVIRGFSARLDPERLPGSTRLVSGRIAKDDQHLLDRVVGNEPAILEGTVHKDGRFQLTLQVPDLEAEEHCLAALAAAGASDLTVRPVRRLLGPGTARLFVAPTSVAESCAFCGRDVGDDPVVETVDSRRVPFCCSSCRQLYLDRYARLKESA